MQPKYRLAIIIAILLTSIYPLYYLTHRYAATIGAEDYVKYIEFGMYEDFKYCYKWRPDLLDPNATIEVYHNEPINEYGVGFDNFGDSFNLEEENFSYGFEHRKVIHSLLSYNQDPEICKILIEAGADLDYRVKRFSRDYGYKLIDDVEDQSEEDVFSGVGFPDPLNDYYTATEDGYWVLDPIFPYIKNKETLRILLKHKAFKFTDHNGYSIMEHAFKLGLNEEAKKLIFNGCETLDAPTKKELPEAVAKFLSEDAFDDDNIFHYLVENNDESFLQKIITPKFKQRVNKRSIGLLDEGFLIVDKNVLLKAVKQDSFGIYKLLLEFSDRDGLENDLIRSGKQKYLDFYRSHAYQSNKKDKLPITHTHFDLLTKIEEFLESCLFLHSPNWPLIEAKRYDLLKAFLHHNIEKNHYFEDALIYAIIKMDSNALKIINKLKPGINLNLEMPVINYFTRKGALDCVKLCLAYHGKINHKDVHGNTALHYAKIFEHKEIYDYLIKNGASKNIKNNLDFTVDDIESKENYLTYLATLEKRQWPVFSRINFLDSPTSEISAFLNSHKDMQTKNISVNNKVDLNHKSINFLFPSNKHKKKQKEPLLTVEVENISLRDLLHYISKQGDFNYLLNSKDEFILTKDKTPLLYSRASKQEELLLKNKYPSLEHALIYIDNLEVMKLLIKSGKYDFTKRDSNGLTALQWNMSHEMKSYLKTPKVLR